MLTTLFGGKAKPIVNDMAFLAVVPLNPKTASIFTALVQATHFAPAHYKAFADAGQALFPLHDEQPFVYNDQNGQTVRYLWLDPQNPKAEAMVLIEGEAKDGKVDLESLLLTHGADFKGALVYQNGCCGSPSVVLLGLMPPPIPAITRDGLASIQDDLRNFWKDKAFLTDEQGLHDINHTVSDAIGGCSTHSQNARPKAQRLAL